MNDPVMLFVAVSLAPDFGTVDALLEKLYALFPRADGFRRPKHTFEPSGEETRAKLAMLNATPDVLASVPDRPGSVFFTAQTHGDQFVGISAVFSRQEPVRRLVAKVHGAGDVDTVLRRLQDVPGWELRPSDYADFKATHGVR
ncbi:MAG TPA: hypothetical protein VGR35_01325 [Tepidisphaeraceae bacterium]|nr:hypothetical protein [Tepidisphaeraceae bacterium]